ncbi:AsmA-like C-terminal region-containing protein [Chelatococcus reniformis]|uniref:AsmA-like C-terminal region-containing protein n=1 Tax=Chelatococcus reniformis TaxID=1494448 RepID=UPI001667A86C|nr:AsmA-like C-terminal region-containing protein [Chelatococcus reniformis]
MRAATYFAGAVVGIALLLVSGLAIRMLMGPVVLEGLSGRVSEALAQRLGPSWKVTVGTAAIEHAGLNPALRVENVEIRNPEGVRALKAPSATVSVDPWALVLGRFVPRSISFTGLDLRLAVTADGTLAFRVGADGDMVQAPPPDRATAAQTGEVPTAAPVALTRAIARAAASAVDLLTASEGAFGGLDRASIEDARLTLLGPDGRVRYQFGEASLRFDKPKDSLRNFKFGLTGGSGRWQLQGTVAGRAGAARVASLTFSDVPVSDLLVLGAEKQAVTTDMPLSGTVRAAVSTTGQLAALDVTMSGSRAVIHTDDPDMPQFVMDEVRLATSYDPATSAILINRLYAAWDGSHVEASGRLEPAEAPVPWRLSLRSSDAFAAAPTPGDNPVKLQKVALLASGVSGGGVILEKGELTAERGSALVSGEFGTEAAGRGVRVNISGEHTDIRAAFAIWPAFAARHVRDFMTDNLRAGMVDRFSVAVDMTDTDIAEARARRPLPERAVRSEVVLSASDYRLGDKLPIIRGSATVVVTARTAKVDIHNAELVPGRGRPVAMPSASIAIADTASPMPLANATARLTGSIDAILGLGTEAGMAQVQIDPSTIRGSADLKLALTLPMAKTLQLQQVHATATGTVSGLTVERVIGKDRLEGGNFTVTLDRTAFSMEGSGQLAGLATDIDVRQPLQQGAVGEATITATLDEAARTKLGLSLGRQISGPIAAKVVAPLSRTEGRGARVDLDLTKTKLDDMLPGWSKPAGRPGRVTFQLADGPGDSHLLDDFAFDAGGVSARGSIEINRDNGLERAKLSSFKLSPADEMRVDLDRTGQTFKITVRGAVIDARPFLKQLFGPEAGARKAGRSKGGEDIELDLSSPILAGFNGESLTNATLRLTKRGPEVRQLNLAGRFGKSPVSVQLVPRDKGSGTLTVQTRDAGALLRYADLYKRMTGGALSLEVAMGDGRQSGTVAIGDFALRNEPAIRRIVSAQPGDAARIDADDVAFTGLRASFTRTAALIDLRDGIIWGPQVGIKLDGTVDFGRDRADLTGTFIPAYALNNVFSRIPLVGPILGGGSNEGVFAVSFRITGPASGPTLTVNPLTAVAPGIFRKFLEVFTPDGSIRQQLAPTQSLGDR